MGEKTMLNKCQMCPHKCKIDRKEKKGWCKAGDSPKLSLVSIHDYEEPCISGENGSGTIFFTGCNMRCVYCQNHKISEGMYGEEITIERLSEIFLEQQSRKVENINLVTPTIYVDQIILAIKLAKTKGLKVPIVYNSSGYESEDSLKKLEGYIDIYLPDFKYASSEMGKKYSGVSNYFETVTKAIVEMKRQKPENIYNEKGVLQSGVIIRHMILPNNLQNSKDVISWIFNNLGKETCISIMSQYFPTHKAKEHPEINRKITKRELKEIEDYLFELNMINGYIQELGEDEEGYVPDFNLKNI